MASKKDSDEEPDPNVLSPNNNAVKIEGKLFYNESTRSWNTIKLKKELFYEFPLLREKSVKFGYTMIIPRSDEHLSKVLKEVKDKAVPILLFFNKENKN